MHDIVESGLKCSMSIIMSCSYLALKIMCRKAIFYLLWVLVIHNAYDVDQCKNLASVISRLILYTVASYDIV